jgi:hypothetical protein
MLHRENIEACEFIGALCVVAIIAAFGGLDY